MNAIVEKTSLEMKCEQMASRFNLTCTQKKTLRELLCRPVHFASHPLFDSPKPMQAILQTPVEVLAGATLDPQAEQTLFLQMNYALFRLSKLRQVLLARNCRSQNRLQEVFDWHQIYQNARDKIIAHNMGLVLSMAKRVQCHGVDFTDLISEGSMALLRAARGYDCKQGFKFSSYACKIILRRHYRTVQKEYAYAKVFPVAFDPDQEIGDGTEYKRDRHLEDQVHEIRHVLEQNLAELTPIEQSVIQLRFFAEQNTSRKMTLQQVGEKLGLTKERIRQIQLTALAKLREVSEQRSVAV